MPTLMDKPEKFRKRLKYVTAKEVIIFAVLSHLVAFPSSCIAYAILY